jgi:hypothetical protein
MVIEDTGRSDRLVVVQVITRKRKKKQKEAFYRPSARRLEARMRHPPSDVMVTMVKDRDLYNR